MPVNFSETQEMTEVAGHSSSSSGTAHIVGGINDQEADYGEHEIPSNLVTDVRWGHWMLDQGMNLRRTAADFYLLYDLSLDELDSGRFQQMMDWILPQFRHYTDMAVGGELRHARGKLQTGYKVGLAAPLKRALVDGTLPSQRHSAWRNWKWFRMTYGSVALAWAMYAFKGFKSSGFGGPRWANIARVLWMFETGKLTPISFIDTCWGLEHNGGAYFNKAWSTAGMKEILDANLHENFDTVRLAASPSVRLMHEANK
jgi:hypothetical protein